MLLQGTIRPRLPKNRSQAHPGVHPISALTQRTQRFQPLPDPHRAVHPNADTFEYPAAAQTLPAGAVVNL